ncbi:unnamed protein product, partial [Soboliphyme baturini]|uniref:phosphopyruvate hydratase n=1 Tax=Soboliphyme baturini TaxID=241478 RepID=A0A183IAM3_9BILA
YHTLKSVIKKRYGLDATAVGDEGGFAPNIPDPKEALDLLKDAIHEAGYDGKVKIGMDVAASEFCKEHDGKKVYDLDFKNPQSDPKQWKTGPQLMELYKSFIQNYPVVSIEDWFDQDDWDSWSTFLKETDIQIVG